MSFMDKARELLGGEKGQKSAMLISGLIQQFGGINGLLEKLQKGGLQEAVSSWIGTGQNLPVSGEQIRSALGSDTVARLASTAGIDPTKASELIANFLPSVVDKMTPSGQLPAAGASPSDLTNVLKDLSA